jgi:hypothetical protein
VSLLQGARQKNACARSCGQVRASPDPVSIPGHRPAAGIRDQPGRQRREGGEARRGEHVTKVPQHCGQRCRKPRIRKHRRVPSAEVA